MHTQHTRYDGHGSAHGDDADARRTGATPRRIRPIRAAAALAGLAMMLAVGACGIGGGTNTAGGTGTAPSTSAVCKAPDFSGPYADEFKRAYEQSKTALGKRILSDCQVTDAELNEIYDAQNKCLAPYGLVMTKGAMTQVSGTLSDDDQRKISEECATKTDLWEIDSMYDALDTNPDNLDANAMRHKIYQCLKSHDLLPKPISEEEYTALDPAGEAPNEEQTLERNRRWNDFFHKYMEYNDDGSRNQDYDADGATRFWQCQTDPVER